MKLKNLVIVVSIASITVLFLMYVVYVVFLNWPRPKLPIHESWETFIANEESSVEKYKWGIMYHFLASMAEHNNLAYTLVDEKNHDEITKWFQMTTVPSTATILY